eukprot:scaffold485_cov272-Pinguiococcus_pyrenoidosus.AAC.14
MGWDLHRQAPQPHAFYHFLPILLQHGDEVEHVGRKVGLDEAQVPVFEGVEAVQTQENLLILDLKSRLGRRVKLQEALRISRGAAVGTDLQARRGVPVARLIHELAALLQTRPAREEAIHGLEDIRDPAEEEGGALLRANRHQLLGSCAGRTHAQQRKARSPLDVETHER